MEPGSASCVENLEGDDRLTRPADCSGAAGFQSAAISGWSVLTPRVTCRTGRSGSAGRLRIYETLAPSVIAQRRRHLWLTILGFEVYSISASIASLRALPLIGGTPPFEGLMGL